MSISVIIPVFNGERTLPAVLRALAKAIPAADEILVVDDGSGDKSGSIAAAEGCRVLRLDRNLGAATAKNRGAASARGNILFFTDDDILVPPDIFLNLTQAFQDPRCDAVVGLLDTNIPIGNFPSQFKNLWMNFTYSRFARSERIGLFYTSAAAIRRECFQQLGGFDERYRGASIAEDTEFGQRAWTAGALIRLEPSLRVVHLKYYGLLSLLREDFRRASALMRMRLRKWGQPFFTSVPRFYQIAIPVLWLAILSPILAFGFAIWDLGLSSPITFWGVALGFFALFLFVLLNVPLFAFLARLRGPGFAVKAVLFLPVDALVVGAGMLFAVLDFARGKRY